MGETSLNIFRKSVRTRAAAESFARARCKLGILRFGVLFALGWPSGVFLKEISTRVDFIYFGF